MSRRLKGQLGYSTAGALLQLYTGTAVVIVVARLVSIGRFGDLAFGLSLAGIVATCGEFGYSLMTSRDVPQRKFDLPSYVTAVLFQKTIVNLAMAAAGLLYLRVFVDRGHGQFWLHALFVFDGVILSYVLYLTALLQALGRFAAPTQASLINALLLSLAIALLKTAHPSFALFCLALVAAQAARLLWMTVAALRFLPGVKLVLDRSIQGYLLRNSWSFGLHYVVGTLYFTIDAQIIYVLLGDAQLALYNAAFRVASLLLLLPDLIMSVFLPHLAGEYASRDGKFDRTVELLFKVMLACGGIFSIGACLFSRRIVLMLFGPKYLASATLFPPLLVMGVLRCLAVIYGALLTISDNQVFRVKVLMASLAVSIAGNGLLVPRFGVMGAAAAAILTHIFLVVSYVLVTRKSYSSSFFDRRSIGMAVAVGAGLALLSWPGRESPALRVLELLAVAGCVLPCWREFLGLCRGGLPPLGRA